MSVARPIQRSKDFVSSTRRINSRFLQHPADQFLSSEQITSRDKSDESLKNKNINSQYKLMSEFNQFDNADYSSKESKINEEMYQKASGECSLIAKYKSKVPQTYASKAQIEGEYATLSSKLDAVDAERKKLAVTLKKLEEKKRQFNPSLTSPQNFNSLIADINRTKQQQEANKRDLIAIQGKAADLYLTMFTALPVSEKTNVMIDLAKQKQQKEQQSQQLETTARHPSAINKASELRSVTSQEPRSPDTGLHH